MKAAADIICLTLMHSFWQAAILTVFLFALNPLIKEASPAFRKRLLLLALCTQVIITMLTAMRVSPGVILSRGGYLTQAISSYPITEILLLAYFSVLIIKFSKLYNSLHALPLLTGETVKAPAEFRIFTAKKATELSIIRKVNVLISEVILVPCTFGFWKPIIILPAAILTRLRPDQIEMLILHELGHIKQNDFIINIFLKALEALYFFNPFILKLIARFKLERESDCDQLVMQHPYPAATYASTLLDLVTGHSGPALAAVSEKGELLKRIQRLPQLKKFQKEKSPLDLLTLFLVLLFCLTILLPVEKNYSGEPKVLFKNTSDISYLKPRDELRVIGKRGKKQPISALKILPTQTTYKKTAQNIRKRANNISMESALEGNVDGMSESSEDTLQKFRSFVHYASLPDGLNEKNITLVEDNGNTTITRSYKLFFRDSTWYYTHLWTIEERTLLCQDSAQ
jgi:beta-lactamase regulating signal transducer with metallopeptidase domain